MKASTRRASPASPTSSPGSGSPDGSARGMPALSQQRRRRRRATRIGLQWRYWSLTNSSVRPSRGQRVDRRVAVRQDDGVEEHRRRRLDGASTSIGSPACRVDRAERRPDEARHRALARSDASASALQRPSPSHAVGDEDRDAPRADAAVAGPREQRQRRRRGHLRRHVRLQHLRHRRRQLAHARARRRPPRPAPARRSSGPTPSARGPPASAPATARSGRR